MSWESVHKEKKPVKLGQVLERRPAVRRKKNISTEHQVWGLRAASKLGVENPSSLIKAARDMPRGIVERALSFAVDYPNARDKQKIFFWRAHQLMKEV